MSVETFAGTHAFHPTVLSDTDADEQGNADAIVEDIECGRCPRCQGPLPTMPEWPAGSRITECRSIPICGRCGMDETFELLDDATGIGFGLSAAGEWPVDVDEIEERHARWMDKARATIITGDGRLITDDGVGQIINPCNTGGWAQYSTCTGQGDA
ncbi:hypothetical protein ACAG26_06905 [Mycobacterium sp. pUA109]|uniref:hypothetical protein n=1 Tax=Mycobacterium sp. pUA109 TaxID=3238982 RepID=UPI00351B2EB6